MTQRKRYALVGTGGRAGMFVDAITTTYKDVAELVAFCDYSQTRMNWYNGRLQNERHLVPLPIYNADQFDQMIAETKPDTVILSYCLVAYAPWEGLRVAITGTKGRIEMDIEETVSHLLGDGQASASKGPFKQARMRVFPMFGRPYELDVPVGAGGHGGADPVMLEQIFSPQPPPDPYHRAASHIDGAASVLVGIAANQAMETGQMVCIEDLFPLAEMMHK